MNRNSRQPNSMRATSGRNVFHPPSMTPPKAPGVLRLLLEADGLHDRCGVMHVSGPNGSVLLEDGHVCWAVRSGMRRLTELLQREKGISRSSLEEVVQRCKATTKPFGEAMVDAGLISSDGLRQALLDHSVEALVLMSGGEVDSFVRHRRGQYDARFRFSPLELMEDFAAKSHPKERESGVEHLARVLGHQGQGAVFRLYGAEPVPIATMGWKSNLRALTDFGNWALSMQQVAQSIDPDVPIACSSYGRAQALAWKHGDELFAGYTRQPRSLARALYERRRR